MHHDLVLSRSIDIQASSAQVWHVLTNPSLIKEYLFGTETVTDWQVGRTVVFRGEYEGQSYEDKGVILQNVPNCLLRYSYWSAFSGADDLPENQSVITYRLDEVAVSLTTLTWIQQGFVSEAGYAHSQNSIPTLLQHIKAIAERN